MIPGLEYEADPSHAQHQGQGGGGGYNNSNNMASPSTQSMSSVDVSPGPQSYNNDQYHLQQLHRRRPHNGGPANGGSYNTNGGSNGGYNNNSTDNQYHNEENKYAVKRKLVKKLDIFPKTERDYTVRTERGGQLTAMGYALMVVLILAEWMTWRGLNGESLEHIVVDTR